MCFPLAKDIVTIPPFLPNLLYYVHTFFQLNDTELQKGKRIGVTISHNNHRLFVGNIPKNKDREELLEEFKKHARKCLEHRTKKITY